MANDNLDFYQSLRKQFKEWLETKAGKNHKYAEYLMFAPDLFHLLCKLTMEKEVSVADKAKLGAAIAYFVSPIDLIPEGIVGPVGYADDIALAAIVLNGIVNNTAPEVVQKHWAGDGDVLEVIKEILKVADEMLGTGLWEKVKNFFNGEDKK
ncbi:MAG: YkvA family protein [Bacteroidales bacterium]